MDVLVELTAADDLGIKLISIAGSVHEPVRQYNSLCILIVNRIGLRSGATDYLVSKEGLSTLKMIFSMNLTKWFKLLKGSENF